MNVPFDSGYAFIADAKAHRSAASYRAPYLMHAADARDPFDWTPEWSRRARGFSTYAALRELGRNGVADLVDRCCRHAEALVRGLANLPGVQVVAEPIINQGLVRFLSNKPGATPQDHDTRTEEIIARIAASGEAFFSGTTWEGRRAMRVSVCNWRTSQQDVQRAVDVTDRILTSISDESKRSVLC